MRLARVYQLNALGLHQSNLFLGWASISSSLVIPATSLRLDYKQFA